MLQCVAHSVLQCFAVCCSVLQYALQRVAVTRTSYAQMKCTTRHRYGDLISQHTATHCNTLQHTATHCNTLQHTAKHCNTLQHPATQCCNTLQHTATHCNTLQTLSLSFEMKYVTRHRHDHLILLHTAPLQHTVTHYNTLQQPSRSLQMKYTTRDHHGDLISIVGLALLVIMAR